MNRTDIVTAVHQSLVETLQQELPAVAEDTRLFDDLHLDSTGILELLMALEEATGIEIDPDNLNMDNFRSVGTLTDYVQSTLSVTG
jgi:acyl carrier protein